jgi:predicted RecB family nuclease
VDTIEDLVAWVQENSLSEFKAGNRKVGKTSEKILREAHAFLQGPGTVVKLKELDFGDRDQWVMFDLEGLLPNLAEDTGYGEIFLWGMKIYKTDGDTEFIPVTAGPGIRDDEDAWITFLETAGEIIDNDPEVPFVHWHHYEKTWIKKYIEKYGDRKEVAARLLDNNLLDLLPVARDSFVFALPSLSLKVIEQASGYKRRLEEKNGMWAVAQFVEAAKFCDEKTAKEKIKEIEIYNEDDLDATWAVFNWLKSIK